MKNPIRPKLIYVNDPLCGWCFGFHPTMDKLAKRFEGRLEIDVRPGGLAVGDRAQTIEEGYSYIKDATIRVENTTGVSFGRNFRLLVEEGSYLLDSVPPALAQMAMRQISPKNLLAFSGDLHNALFVDGKDMNRWGTYEGIIEKYDVDEDNFHTLWESSELKNKLDENFEWCRRAGAAGFPTLLLNIGDETSLMARGYRPYDVIESHLQHLLNNLEKISGE